MFGLLRSPTTSQTALPNAFAPANHVFHSGASHRGGTPQWSNAVRSMNPTAPWATREGAPVGRGHDGDGPGTGERGQLDPQRPEPAGGAPHEHHVALLHGVRGPAVEHAVGRRAREGGRRGLLPREALGLRQALVRLHLGELRERAPARVVAPDAERRRETRVPALGHPRVVEVPLAGVHDDVVAHAYVRDALSHRVHDAGGIRAHHVELRWLAPPGLGLRDVHRHTASGPHVVEVHPRRHDHHERLVRTDLGDVDDLVADRVRRVAVPVGSDELRMHPRRNLAHRWDLADVVHVLGHARSDRDRGSGRR